MKVNAFVLASILVLVPSCKKNEHTAPALAQPSPATAAADKPDEAVPPTTPPPTTGDIGFCEVTITGDIERKFRTPGDGDLRSRLLLINCSSSELLMTFMPELGTDSANVRFGPGKKYELAKSGKPGQFSTSLALKNQDEGLFYPVQLGSLDITKFDKTGLQATFAFDAAEPEAFAEPGKAARKLKVSGVIDLKCNQDNCGE